MAPNQGFKGHHPCQTSQISVRGENGLSLVNSPAGTDLNRVVKAAWKKAHTVGCDLIIDRAIYQVPIPQRAPPSAALNPAQAASTCQYAAPMYQPPYAPAAAPAPGQREFICAVWGPPLKR